MGVNEWKAATRLAGSQRGLITHDQLIGCGLTLGSITLGVRNGRLTRIHQGVYAVGPPSTDPRARLLAAVLAAGGGAVLCDMSAAGHQRLIAPAPDRVSIAVPTPGGRARPGLEIHRRRLHPSEIMVFDAVPCTTPSRTILDLCARSAALGERALRNAGARGLLDVAALRALLTINHGRRGTARLRLLLDGPEQTAAFTRSELERKLVALCRRYALPSPDLNQDVWAGERVYECDAVWPDARLIVECDSGWHDNPVVARRDAKRDQDLTMAGWRVFRVRWAQLVNDAPRTAATVRRLLEDQRRLLAATRR